VAGALGGAAKKQSVHVPLGQLHWQYPSGLYFLALAALISNFLVTFAAALKNNIYTCGAISVAISWQDRQ